MYFEFNDGQIRDLNAYSPQCILPGAHMFRVQPRSPQLLSQLRHLLLYHRP